MCVRLGAFSTWPGERREKASYLLLVGRPRLVLLYVAVSAALLAACSSASDGDYVDTQGPVTSAKSATPPSVSVEPPPTDAPRTTAASLSPSTATNGAKNTVGPLTPGQLSRIARHVSTRLAEPNLDTIEAVLTTQSKADQLVGDQVAGDVPAYLIEMHGTFSTAWESRPAGASVPPKVTGSLGLVVNAYTGEQLDMGLRTQGVDLAALGPVISLF